MGLNLRSKANRLKALTRRLGLSLVVHTFTEVNKMVVRKVKPDYLINFKIEPSKKEGMFWVEASFGVGVKETMINNPLGTGDKVREDSFSSLNQTEVDTLLVTPNTTGYRELSGKYPLYRQSDNLDWNSTTTGCYSVNSNSQPVNSNWVPSISDPYSVISNWDPTNLSGHTVNSDRHSVNPDSYSVNSGRHLTNPNIYPPKPAGYRTNEMGPSSFPQPVFYNLEETITSGWSGSCGNPYHREATLKNECLSPVSSTAYMSPKSTSSSQSYPSTRSKLYTQETFLPGSMSRTGSIQTNSQISAAHQTLQQ